MPAASRPRVLLESQVTPSFSCQPPAPDLRPYVELYCQSTPAVPLTSYALPNYSGLLSFSLGGPPWVSVGADGVAHTFAGSQVLGPLTQCRTCRYPAGTRLLSVKLRPGALALLLGQPAVATLNLHAPLASLLPGADLEVPLAAAPDLATRVALLEPWLRALLARRPADYRYQLVQAATQCLALPAAGPWLLPAVADRLCVTPRSLGRYFGLVVGVSPQRLARRVRFGQALALYRQHGGHFAAEAAGYADFAHLAKASRQLTGRRLGEL